MIKVLFVGESPPASGAFFYLANSSLFHYTRAAFSQVYGQKCQAGASFLEFFKSLGCYLDDLCPKPVNNLDDSARDQNRVEAIPGLAERMRRTTPLSVVVVMSAILHHVESAIDRAGIGRLPVFSLPFPASGNQKKYVEKLIAVLTEMRNKGFLA